MTLDRRGAGAGAPAAHFVERLPPANNLAPWLASSIVSAQSAIASPPDHDSISLIIFLAQGKGWRKRQKLRTADPGD
jgi:hypothetical protein